MKKLILASAALMATFGMETGITPVDNVVKGVFAQTAEAQSNNAARCRFYRNANSGGSSFTRYVNFSDSDDDDRFANNVGNMPGNFDRAISSAQLRVNDGAGSRSTGGSLVIYNVLGRRSGIPDFSLSRSLFNSGGTRTSTGNVSSADNDRGRSFLCILERSN